MLRSYRKSFIPAVVIVAALLLWVMPGVTASLAREQGTTTDANKGRAKVRRLGVSGGLRLFEDTCVRCIEESNRDKGVTIEGGKFCYAGRLESHFSELARLPDFGLQKMGMTPS